MTKQQTLAHKFITGTKICLRTIQSPNGAELNMKILEIHSYLLEVQGQKLSQDKKNVKKMRYWRV